MANVVDRALVFTSLSNVWHMLVDSLSNVLQAWGQHPRRPVWDGVVMVPTFDRNARHVAARYTDRTWVGTYQHRALLAAMAMWAPPPSLRAAAALSGGGGGGTATVTVFPSQLAVADGAVARGGFPAARLPSLLHPRRPGAGPTPLNGASGGTAICARKLDILKHKCDRYFAAPGRDVKKEAVAFRDAFARQLGVDLPALWGGRRRRFLYSRGDASTRKARGDPSAATRATPPAFFFCFLGSAF